MKILFTGGGTAGHVTPNIALIDILHDKADCLYVGTDGMEKGLISPLAESGKVKKYYEISAWKFKRTFAPENLLLPFRLIKSVCSAKKVIADVQPDVVFSKGGYVGLPVILAAKLLKIPSVVHESDLTMGLANKLSAKFCTTLLSTFPCGKKAEVSGAVVRQDLFAGSKENGLKIMKFDGKKPVLLIMGGSLGAVSLNDAVAKNRKLADRFDIFVICGKGKSFSCDFVNEAEFVTDMADVYAAADVAVSRAGSNSLVELTVCEIPFVAVPLSKGSRGEQLKNAEYFCNRKCGIMLRDEEAAASLCNAVNTLYDNRAFYSSNCRKMKIDGTENVAEAILAHGK